MKVVSSLLDPSVLVCLESGGVVVVRTDTIYGLLARADDERAVQRVFAIKGRSDYKSPIVLIARLDQTYAPLDMLHRELASKVWPGKTTIAVPVDKTSTPPWLHCGNDEFGHRMPAKDDLRLLIEKTGPLIAPSANPEGLEPAKTIQQAIDYFGDAVDIYVDGGVVTDNAPSQLLRIDESGGVERLR